MGTNIVRTPSSLRLGKPHHRNHLAEELRYQRCDSNADDGHSTYCFEGIQCEHVNVRCLSQSLETLADMSHKHLVHHIAKQCNAWQNCGSIGADKSQPATLERETRNCTVSWLNRARATHVLRGCRRCPGRLRGRSELGTIESNAARRTSSKHVHMPNHVCTTNFIHAGITKGEPGSMECFGKASGGWVRGRLLRLSTAIVHDD